MILPPHRTLYQASTSIAPVEGIYQAAVRVGTLRERGDLGLGTFENLDGEIMVVDGPGHRLVAHAHEAPAAPQDEVARAALPRLVGRGVTLEIALLPVGEELADRTHPLATASISLHV